MMVRVREPEGGEAAFWRVRRLVDARFLLVGIVQVGILGSGMDKVWTAAATHVHERYVVIAVVGRGRGSAAEWRFAGSGLFAKGVVTRCSAAHHVRNGRSGCWLRLWWLW